MKAALRARSTALAALLLAAQSLAGLAVESHGPEVLAAGADHAELPTFEAGHSRPDPTLHVEGATPTPASPCIGCLIRPTPRAGTVLRIAHGVTEPTGFVSILHPDRPSPADPRRLPPPRAPPAA